MVGGLLIESYLLKYSILVILLESNTDIKFTRLVKGGWWIVDRNLSFEIFAFGGLVRKIYR